MQEFDLSKIKPSYYDINVGLNLPGKPSAKLAEFLGILTGDGYMNLYGKYFSLLEIAGDSRLDREYLLIYVKDLIKGLFNITPKIVFRKDQNTMYLRIMSKGLISYLEKIGFKKGKKEQISISRWILNDDEYFRYFIKGLADTDFSLSLRKQKKLRYYPKISIRSKSKILIKLVNKWLISKNFKTYTRFDYVQLDKRGYNESILHQLGLNGRENLEKWMKLVSFRNKRQLVKYYKYK